MSTNPPESPEPGEPEDTHEPATDLPSAQPAPQYQPPAQYSPPGPLFPPPPQYPSGGADSEAQSRTTPDQSPRLPGVSLPNFPQQPLPPMPPPYPPPFPSQPFPDAQHVYPPHSPQYAPIPVGWQPPQPPGGKIWLGILIGAGVPILGVLLSLWAANAGSYGLSSGLAGIPFWIMLILAIVLTIVRGTRRTGIGMWIGLAALPIIGFGACVVMIFGLGGAW